ncbi:MAG: tetratricopeptide repeat protein, partial [Chloroflexota bacterium]|nr:tetratricopeptide repeat protein [Chloroflexota bacterium]
EIEAHTQLLPLLVSLRGLVPLLCIGQKTLIETDVYCPLAGLSLAASAQLIQEAAISIAESVLTRLHSDTGGNPRLLALFIALVHSLQRSGETPLAAVETALASFAHEPSLEFLLRRIWQHLNDDEMILLELLSVFRNPAPRSAWNEPAQQAAIAQLMAWQLVQIDARDGIFLVPALRAAIYQTLLPSDQKELRHLEAGALRIQYGQFTAAAYHYAAGGEGELALDLLYTHREQEIDQGQAEAALAVLSNISLRKLGQENQQKYTLLRAELQKLLGHYASARATLQTVYWSKPFLAAQRWRLDGDIAEARGEVSHAQNAYQTGLATIETLLSEAAYFHRDLGYLYANEVDFVRADAEVARVRHEAANLEGFIGEMRGDLPGAEIAYTAAFQFAQASGYAYGEANTHNNLGRIYGWRRQLATAEAHLQAAIEFFRNTGRLSKLASATYNLALAHRLAKQYAAALAPAEEALNWFVHLGEVYGRAVAHELLAEIFLGLDNLAQAARYAHLVIAEEHTSSIPDGLRTLGEVRMRQGDLLEAEQLLRQSLTLAQVNTNRILEGYAWRSLGELYTTRSDLPAAQASFAQAQQIFRELGLAAELEQMPETGDRT